MGVLEVVQGNLIEKVSGPVTNKTGGTSKGDPAAGGDGSGGSNPILEQDIIETKDRAGAGIITTIVLVWVIGGVWWMVS